MAYNLQYRLGRLPPGFELERSLAPDIRTPLGPRQSSSYIYDFNLVSAIE